MRIIKDSNVLIFEMTPIITRYTSYKAAAISIVDTLKRKEFPSIGRILKANSHVAIECNSIYYINGRMIAFGFKNGIAINEDVKKRSHYADFKLRKCILDYCAENNYTIHYINQDKFNQLFDSQIIPTENSYNKTYQKELIEKFDKYLIKDKFLTNNSDNINKALRNECN